VLIAVVLGFTVVGTYNSLVSLDSGDAGQWGQVETPPAARGPWSQPGCNRQGRRQFEQQTLTAVTEARARVGQVTSGAVRKHCERPQAFARFQQAQDGLSSALSRLMVVAEKYPELKATAGFSRSSVAARRNGESYYGRTDEIQ